MDRTTLLESYPKEEDIIRDSLKWLIKNKEYRDDTQGGKASKATVYNAAWLRFINRCKEYPKQVVLVNWIKRIEFDKEIKDKLLEILELPEEEFDIEEALKLLDSKGLYS